MLPRALAAATTRGRATAVLGALLLAGGIAARYPLVAGLGACLLALVVAEVIAVLGARPVRVRRSVSPHVVVRHEGCEGRLVVSGRRRRGLVRLDVADRVGATFVPVPLPDELVDGSDGAAVTYDIPTPRRGLVDVGPVLVRLVGLAGMAALSTESGSVDQVRVLPRRIPVSTMLRGHRRSAAGADDSLDVGGTDLVGLHEYGMGDDLRRLHWATSARSGTLMVREDAEPSQPHVCVVLDDRAEGYLGGADLFEEAVELAAALCRTATASGHPLRLTTVSGRYGVQVAGSAVARPGHGEDELDAVFAEIDLTGSLDEPALPARDLDVAVAVTGPGADLRHLSLSLGVAPSRVIAVVDPAPAVSAHHEFGVLVLRGATSVSIAQLWDGAVR